MSKKKRMIFHFTITIILIGLGILIMITLTAGKPRLEKRKSPTAVPVVQTVNIKTGSRSVIIRGEGTVRPLKEIRLVPQVGGEIVFVSPNLVNGGEFEKDDTLLRIDPVDYRLAVTLAEAKVKEAESDLEMALEETTAAREEWHLHYNGGSKSAQKPPPLVAKEPQLAAARARLEGDRADYRKAVLNLERTELKAPFSGRVSEESIDIGQYVSPGQSIANLYSTEAAEIVLPLEDKKLFWFHVPGFTSGNGPGSEAIIRADIAGLKRTWSGRVMRVEGKLDEQTRMINVVVRVKNPYSGKPPLAMGLFVIVDIKGSTIFDAAVIPRAALRQGDVVWVVKNNGRLHFRKVDVARIQGEKVLIKSGLVNGDTVVISSLEVVSDSMTVRTVLKKEVGES